MKRRWLLLLWLLGILAPMAWLARFIPGYEQLFNFVFGPAWMHWVSHALLFAVLSFLLLTLLVPKGGGRWSRVALALILVMMVAWAQERIQLWYKARAWGGDEWFDLAVDFSGAAVGALAFWWARTRSKLRTGGR
jgi:VanZ family protein